MDYITYQRFNKYLIFSQIFYKSVKIGTILCEILILISVH